MEKTRIVEIDGTQYQLARFSAEDGSYILMQILGTVARATDQNPPASTNGNAQAESAARAPDEIIKGMTFAAFLNGLSYEAHCFIQKKCLSLCSRIEGSPAVPMPLAGLPEVRNDMQLALRLEVETLCFNFSDFFAKGGLQATMGSQPSRV